MPLRRPLTVAQLSEADTAAIVALYNGGRTVTSLAEDFRVPARDLRQHLRRLRRAGMAVKWAPTWRSARFEARP